MCTCHLFTYKETHNKSALYSFPFFEKELSSENLAQDPAFKVIHIEGNKKD